MKNYENYNPITNIKEEVPPVHLEDNAPVVKKRRAQKRDADTAEKTPKRKRASARKSEPDRTGFFDSLRKFATSTSTRLILGIVLGCFGIYLAVAFISYFTECVRDQAAISNAAIGSAKGIGNAAGEGGARLSEYLINETFGLGSFVIILWLICISLKLLVGRPKFKTVNFTIKCIVALITVSLIIGLLTLGLNSTVNWGGYHGRYANEFVIHFLGWWGAAILCLMFLAIFVVICLRDVIKWIMAKRRAFLEKRRAIAEAKAERERLERELEEMKLQEMRDAVKAGEAMDNSEKETVDDRYVHFGDTDEPLDYSPETYDIEEDDFTVTHGRESHDDQGVAEGEDETDNPGCASASDLVSDSGVESPSVAAGPAESSQNDTVPASNDAGAGDDEIAEQKMVVNVNTIGQVETPKLRTLKDVYKFPSPELLLPGSNKVSVDVEEQEANKKRIRDTLLYHGIPITSIEATVGPTVTLYEIRPDQGIKIARIKNLADDIALSLSAIGVRIIAPIPGKGTVGIEVANNDPQTVSMRTIIQSRKYAESKYRLPVALGSTIGNDVYIADLAKMPHLLVAGATGQGKSVGLNAIISSLLYKKRPDELKFVMIDPKEVEFSIYAKIEKQYLAKIPGDGDAIVTDMSKVVATLSSLCVEMDNRYKLLRAAEVRNVEEYNEKIAQHKLSRSEGHRFLPYIVVVVDEFADLIMTSGKEVETPIARLAQKARAIGIHVIIATQRPSTNVITGIIKANFPVRIAFKVTSGVDSKTILDTTGAQQLIGRGDMLISFNSQMVRVQCAFIDTPEVTAICNHISHQPYIEGPYILPEPQTTGEDSDAGNSGFGGDRDPLFEDAARYVVGSGTASTSSLQRRYSIGYNRAGKIMDQLENYGFVGPSMGGKARDVKIDLVSLENVLASLV